MIESNKKEYFYKIFMNKYINIHPKVLKTIKSNKKVYKVYGIFMNK